MSLDLTDVRYCRGLKSTGTIARFSTLLQKPDRPIIYGAIGGSITAGASAAPHEKCYVSQFGNWLDRECTAGCETVNAGIGASNSFFGAFRAQKDLLAYKPDIITIEYAVNDLGSLDEIELAYEALVRQCLQQDNHPTVILIFTMRRNGDNCQVEHMRIGNHYDLPMLSYRDAVYPDIEAGLLTWEDVSPDEVHPNNAGHGFIAEMLQRLVTDAKSAAPTAVSPIPARLNPESVKFANGAVIDADSMTVTSNQGWTKGPHKGGYTGFQSEEPGAELSLTFTGRFVSIGYQKYAGDFGRAELIVDNGNPIILEGYYERPPIQAWAGGHTVLHTLVDSPESAEYTLTIRLLPDKHPASNGHKFDVGYLLLS